MLRVRTFCVKIEAVLLFFRHDKYDAKFEPAIKEFCVTDLGSHMEQMFHKASVSCGRKPTSAKCGGITLRNCTEKTQNIMPAKVTNTSNLDEQGVIWSVCRHMIFHSYSDMHVGESYGRVAAVLVAANAQLNAGALKAVYYDNMCKFEGTLAFQAKQHSSFKELEDLANVERLLVPTFHVSTHNSFCQIDFNAKWRENAGSISGGNTLHEM